MLFLKVMRKMVGDRPRERLEKSWLFILSEAVHIVANIDECTKIVIGLDGVHQ